MKKNTLKVEKLVDVQQPDGSYKTEKITVEEAVTFWSKYKEILWPIIVMAAAALGFSVDKIGSLLPDTYGVVALKEVVAEHELRLDEHDAIIGGVSQNNPEQEPENGVDIKVSK